MDRRTFVKSVAGAGAGLGFLSACSSQPDNKNISGRRVHSVGLQLYTVRDLMKEDPLKTIRDIAAIGYDEVEFAGYHGVEPSRIKEVLEEVGLRSPATHWMPSTLMSGLAPIASELDEALEAAGEIGHSFLVLPWIQGNDSLTLDDYRQIADTANQIGQECQKAGVQLAYHNHDFEFRGIDGVLPMDLLLSETDPSLVQWEMDFFWVVKGGQRPLDYIDRYPGRISLCHVKDMSHEGEMVDVGSGTIDFASIFAASETAGLRHYFVEHDQPVDPMATVTASFDHLTTLTFTSTKQN